MVKMSLRLACCWWNQLTNDLGTSPLTKGVVQKVMEVLEAARASSRLSPGTPAEDGGAGGGAGDLEEVPYGMLAWSHSLHIKQRTE